MRKSVKDKIAIAALGNITAALIIALVEKGIFKEEEVTELVNSSAKTGERTDDDAKKFLETIFIGLVVD